MEKSTFTREYGILRDLLREARESAALTQEEVAQELGETQSFVSKCERGERRLDLVQLQKFCRALGTNLAEFVDEYEARTGRRPRQP